MESVTVKRTRIFRCFWIWDGGKIESTKLFRKFRFSVRQNFLKCGSSMWNKIPYGSVESLPRFNRQEYYSCPPSIPKLVSLVNIFVSSISVIYFLKHYNWCKRNTNPLHTIPFAFSLLLSDLLCVCTLSKH